MKSIRHLMAATGLTVLMTGSAFADEDLINCTYRANGVKMDQRVCDVLRKRAYEQAEEKKRGDAKRAADRAKYEEEQQKAAKERQAREDAVAARIAESRARQEEQRAMALKAQQEQIRWEKAAAKAAADKEAALKAECGKDYKSIAIGMSIERAQKCVANLKLTGQINRADGVVSTYRAGRLYAHVMDGRIVSWGR